MQESEGVLCMRVSFRIALAGQVIGVSALYEQTRTFCKNYLTDAPASFEVAVTPADIAFEREKNDREAAVEGHAPGNFSDEYLETLALYRKIVERLLEWDTLLFHGSCISVDSKAYLFTAKSGTGKSTHTQLWKKWFGERAVFINDDKTDFSGELDLDIPPPLIRRKNSNRVEYNVHFSSYVGTFSIFPFIFRQKEKSHRPSDQ